MVRGGRKFHIRSYIAVVEKLQDPSVLDVYIFNRHEVRVAGVAVQDSTGERDAKAHITNGALSGPQSERLLLSTVPELSGLEPKLERFLAEAFGMHLLPDITRRISASAREDGPEYPIQKFAVAGLDLMVTEDHSIYLLEVNVHPSAPPAAMVPDVEFQDHLKGFLRELMDLVQGKEAPHFVNTDDVLEKYGLLEE